MDFINPNLLSTSLNETTVRILYTTVERTNVVIKAKNTSKSPILLYYKSVDKAITKTKAVRHKLA